MQHAIAGLSGTCVRTPSAKHSRDYRRRITLHIEDANDQYTLQPTPTPKLKRTVPKRTLADKQRTNAHLQQELTEDLAATNGAARIHLPPASKGSSKNPNETVMFNFVDHHFLNWEAHEEAVAIVEGWRPKAWRGQIWYAQRGIDRVWTGPTHTDLQWTGAEWVSYKRHDGSDVIPEMPAPSSVPLKLTEALQRAIQVGKSGGIAEKELNAVYMKYLADPSGQRDSLYITLSAFARSAKRVWQINHSFWNKAEIYLDLDDIFAEFIIDLIRRIEKKQYIHEGKMQNWIGYIWNSFFFPGIETKMNKQADRNIYVNGLDPDFDGYESQNHAVGKFQIEDEQAQREQEGFHTPLSRDRIFRQMNKPTQTIVEMLAEGLTRDEIAVNLKISTRQLLRRTDQAEAEGEAIRAMLHTVQACADEGYTNVVSIDTNEDYGGFIGDIQACAEQTLSEQISSRDKAWKLEELASLLNCSRGKLYKMVNSGRIPYIRVGSMIRFDPKSTSAWIEDKAVGF
jgi:excisionase family DNA binding protein